jgi:6-phosphofructokinase 1
MAVKYTLEGKSGYMVSLVRESDDPYSCTTGLAPLEKIANAKKDIPAEYISPEGNDVTEKFIQYVKPLAGELLPNYMRFEKYPVGKLLEEYQR